MRVIIGGSNDDRIAIEPVKSLNDGVHDSLWLPKFVMVVTLLGRGIDLIEKKDGVP